MTMTSSAVAREGELGLPRRGRVSYTPWKASQGNRPCAGLSEDREGCLSFGSHGGVRGEWDRVSFLQSFSQGLYVNAKVPQLDYFSYSSQAFLPAIKKPLASYKTFHFCKRLGLVFVSVLWEKTDVNT